VQIYNILKDSKIKKYYDQNSKSTAAEYLDSSSCKTSPGKQISKDIIQVNPNFPISMMKYNLEGDMLAVTCSNDNLVKIYKIPQRKRLFTLQTQIKGEYQIVDFVFCSVSSYFAVLLAERVDK